MSNIRTNIAMRALPAATAGGVVAGMRGGHFGLPLPSRPSDFGIARMAIA